MSCTTTHTFPDTSSSDNSEAPPDCDTELNTGPGVWIEFIDEETPRGSVTLDVCTANFDTKMAIFEVEADGSTTCIQGNDDSNLCGTNSRRSAVDTSRTGSNACRYLVYVTGFGSSTGTFTLKATC